MRLHLVRVMLNYLCQALGDALQAYLQFPAGLDIGNIYTVLQCVQSSEAILALLDAS